jgi:hypothetical protein
MINTIKSNAKNLKDFLTKRLLINSLAELSLLFPHWQLSMPLLTVDIYLLNLKQQ